MDLTLTETVTITGLKVVKKATDQTWMMMKIMKMMKI